MTGMTRTWRYGLTADEWLHLAAEGQDSEVQSCCGDIGQLQEWLNCLATSQGMGQASLLRQPVLDAYETALASHDGLDDRKTFPLLHRVLDELRAEQAEWEAMTAEIQAEFARRQEEAGG
jgi:hypothetical protein